MECVCVSRRHHSSYGHCLTSTSVRCCCACVWLTLSLKHAGRVWCLLYFSSSISPVLYFCYFVTFIVLFLPRNLCKCCEKCFLSTAMAVVGSQYLLALVLSLPTFIGYFGFYPTKILRWCYLSFVTITAPDLCHFPLDSMLTIWILLQFVHCHIDSLHFIELDSAATVVSVAGNVLKWN